MVINLTFMKDSSMIISRSPAWKALQKHSKDIKKLHLRDLLTDSKRSMALRAEVMGLS